MEGIYSNVAQGGTLTRYADVIGVPFYYVRRYISTNPDFEKLYQDALKDRAEWVREVVLDQLNMIATFNAADLFDADGSLKSIDDWSDAAKAMVSGIEIADIWDGKGEDREKVGELKKVKLLDKLKSIDMIGKNQKLWSDPKDDSKGLKLEDILALATKGRETPSLPQPSTIAPGEQDVTL